MIMSTLDNIPGYIIHEVKGAVHAHFFLPGGDKEPEQLRTALSDIERQASRLGANVIIDLKINTVATEGTARGVFMGTAVSATRIHQDDNILR